MGQPLRYSDEIYEHTYTISDEKLTRCKTTVTIILKTYNNKSCSPGETPTPNPWFRKPMLCAVELLDLIKTSYLHRQLVKQKHHKITSMKISQLNFRKMNYHILVLQRYRLNNHL